MGLVTHIIIGIHKGFTLAVDEQTFTAEEISTEDRLRNFSQDDFTVESVFPKL